MTYLDLTYAHLATVLPALFIGTYLMVRRKGTVSHKAAGRIYLGLLFITSIITLFMQAKVGPLFLEHFGFIHLLSVLTLYSVPAAYFAARKHQVRRHRILMVSTYIGAILVAGALAFAPGRFLHEVLVAEAAAAVDGGTHEAIP